MELKKKALDLNLENSQGYTPLMLACARGDQEMIGFLAENNVNPDIIHPTAGGVLIQACRNGGFSVVMLLLEKFPSLILSQGPKALLVSFEEEKKEILNALKKRVDANAVLAEAVHFCPAWIKKYLKNDGHVSFSASAVRDSLLIACTLKGPKAAQLLIDIMIAKGLSLDIAGEDGRSALMRACVEGSPDTLRHMLANGANPEYSGIENILPLSAVSIEFNKCKKVKMEKRLAEVLWLLLNKNKKMHEENRKLIFFPS